MKVVINKCYGGYGLSRLALQRYAELKKMPPVLFYTSDPFNDRYRRVSATDDLQGSISVCCVGEDLGEFTTGDEAYKNQVLEDHKIERHDPILVKVVEELKAEADAHFAKLKIVKIPDGVEYDIAEYNGKESIQEKHRSWA